MNRKPLLFLPLLLLLLASCSLEYQPDRVPGPTYAPGIVRTPTPWDRPAVPAGSLYSYISEESLLGFIADLTAIQPYSGWRNSATEGEAEALDYVATILADYGYLQGLGLEVERQHVRTFMATELWETRLHLTVSGQEIEVPAEGLRGPRDEIDLALRFDSDGTLNDTERNPRTAAGPIVLCRTMEEVRRLSNTALEGKILFLDYATIDRAVLGRSEAQANATEVLSKRPAGLVLVTQFTNQIGASHGAFVGDNSVLNWVQEYPYPPTLFVQIENLAPAGINDWSDLAQVAAARLTWDTDVLSPADTGNLVARIPGKDPSRAVILGAHIDSPNAPGAMDDGSGSAVLLEVAHVLDAARFQPETDVYLVWFGSEETSFYGAGHFVATHQELLDRTTAMLQVDCLAYPLDGIHPYLNLVAWSYSLYGDGRLTWPDFLNSATGAAELRAYAADYHGPESDNSTLTGFDVPNANLILADFPRMEEVGGFHYAAQVHAPYDTLELASQMGSVLENMAHIALAAAIETGVQDPTLRVAPPPTHRALFVASHTESPHLTPVAFSEIGMTLAWEGYDVDLIPYGQPVTAADLEGVELVVILPVLDYPCAEGDVSLYDEAWRSEEIAVLEGYVADGGFLVLTNSARRLKFGYILEENEDWSDANALAARFGITYQAGPRPAEAAVVEGDNPLVAGVRRLALAEDNAVPFQMTTGEVLARTEQGIVAALVAYGPAGGEVLVLADVGILRTPVEEDPANLTFWQNLARYAYER
jgi:hypothetical protein